MSLDRRWIAQILVACSAALLTLILAPRAAEACRCKPTPSLEDELARAEVVFIADPEEPASGASGASAGDARVTRVFKGSVPARVTLAPTDCPPYPFTVNEGDDPRGPILIYGYRGGSQIMPMMCGRTARIARAGADVAKLEQVAPGHAPDGATPTSADAGATGPSPEPTRPPPGCGCNVPGATNAASGGLALFFLLVLAGRRRRA